MSMFAKVGGSPRDCARFDGSRLVSLTWMQSPAAARSTSGSFRLPGFQPDRVAVGILEVLVVDIDQRTVAQELPSPLSRPRLL